MRLNGWRMSLAEVYHGVCHGDVSVTYSSGVCQRIRPRDTDSRDTDLPMKI